ncbi:unnamed protein product [Rotaria socialis]|uniref:Secreted protein n=1 Tax=Rotaria socialis TaxID=392032 RepID=A0A821NUH3_9BILA|nr:unnamed protein product [Rotaria socialis]CAF3684976.1 unnamed protein product [Rotaria socialis]CAF4535804.1 unnamed protein product [Rotaria socialis]CAF4794368.1 unnamed protein product [Rotaria socialis]
MNFLVTLFAISIITVCYGDITIYRGTACGWAELTTSTPILCNGTDPRLGCPSGYSRQLLDEGVTYCYKINTTSGGKNGIPGTLCGGLARAACGGFIPNKQCPPGYTQDYRYICYKSDPEIEDLSGTICGVISGGKGQTCNRLQKGTCPDGYYAINFDQEDWHGCFKK